MIIEGYTEDTISAQIVSCAGVTIIANDQVRLSPFIAQSDGLISMIKSWSNNIITEMGIIVERVQL